MKLTRIAAIAVPAAALTTLAAVSVPSAAHAATAHTAAAHAATAHAAAGHPAQTTQARQATSNVAVYDCQNQPQVRPGSFDVFCDGSGYLADLHWSSWTTSMATATGVEYINNCEPNCAAGKFSHQNVDVVFWRSEPVKGHKGHYGYSQMTVLLPNAKTGHNTYTSVPPGAFPGEF
jgi:hypothetical protein